MSIEEVERIMDETQEAVEYQRVCIACMCFLEWSAMFYHINPPTHLAAQDIFVVPPNFLILEVFLS